MSFGPNLRNNLLLRRRACVLLYLAGKLVRVVFDLRYRDHFFLAFHWLLSVFRRLRVRYSNFVRLQFLLQRVNLGFHRFFLDNFPLRIHKDLWDHVLPSNGLCFTWPKAANVCLLPNIALFRVRVTSVLDLLCANRRFVA